MPRTTRYAIGDLADLGGVSRRTVRYYVQEGLLPAPFGVGRGNHYGPEHLDQLLRVKALQEWGTRSTRFGAPSSRARESSPRVESRRRRRRGAAARRSGAV